MIFGCIFAYFAVILLGSDFGSEPDLEHFDYMCAVSLNWNTKINCIKMHSKSNYGGFPFSHCPQVRAYLLATGFSLAFGAMFAKTYRVHRIFTRSCAGVVKNRVSMSMNSKIIISVSNSSYAHSYSKIVSS